MTARIEFRLAEGRDIGLVSLDQRFTYEGLLEGLPTVESNRRLLEGLRVAKPAQRPDIACLLLPPPETLILWESERPYPFGTPASLPAVICVGRFRSSAPARAGDYSELIVTWLQDAFALPISPDVVEQLTRIEWAKVASDLEY